MPQEIKIDGIGISPDVLTAIVSRAVSDVEGIASVGVKDLATNLVSMMLSSKAPASEPAVEAEVIGDKLALTVRVVVFFGYPFKKLAEAVRAAVVAAIDAQVGVEVERVDVCIDGLVFPTEYPLSLKVYRGRTLARSQALQLLFQAEATDSPLERVLEGDFLISKGPLDPYALELCRGAYEHIDRIDCALRAVAKNWDLMRMPGADRNLLRIAVYEMRFLTDEEVSDAIVINEAVELAKAYGTDQSASFVNGVLGKIARSEELPGEDLYQELLAEDRAREEAQAAEAAAKVAVAQAEAGVLAEDADAAEAVVDSVEE